MGALWGQLVTQVNQSLKAVAIGSKGMDKPPHKVRSSTAASSSKAMYKKETSQQQQSKNARATQHNCKRFVKFKNEFQIIQKYLDEVPSCTWTHHYHWTVFSERAHNAMGWQQMDTICLFKAVCDVCGYLH